jgi:hypothetical protein
LRGQEADRIASEGPQILELGATSIASIQVGPAVVQLDRSKPAIEVGFQLILREVSD